MENDKQKDKSVTNIINQFYKPGTNLFALGVVFNVILVFLILLFTAFFPYSSIYSPKLFNYPFVSTCLTIGLYMCCCIQDEQRFRIATAASSLIAFLTTALYLNELSNTSVTIANRFSGSFAYAMLNPANRKALQITSTSRDNLDADIEIYTGLIVVVSYAIVVNFMHFLFSLIYLFRRNIDSTKRCCLCYGWDRSKPGDSARFIGSVFAFIVVLLSMFQSVFSISIIGVIIPSYFPDTFAFTVFVCCIALNPPVIHFSEAGSGAEATPLTGGTPKVIPGTRVTFGIYLTFLVLGCFYTIANYVIDSTWRIYNDVGVICETNSTKLFQKEFEYLIDNSTYAGQLVKYTALESSIIDLTFVFYCMDGVISLVMVICLLCATLSHFAMLKYIC